jgi:endonuclease/exonuclease/phosphatase family metal-dependent hydrolase
MRVRVPSFHGVLAFLFCALTAVPASAQWAFGGSPAQIPGTIQAEDFDEGGQGLSYWDDSWGNNGGAYRSTDVDIAGTPTGGNTIGWAGAGEWLRYTVNVTASGYYTVVARVASAGPGGAFHLEFNGEDRSGAIWVPNTGSWENYQDSTATVWLDAGVQVMRLVFDVNSGSTNAVGNISSFRFEGGGGGGGSSSGGASSAFGGSAWGIPGTIQTEDFDNGGQFVGYFDQSPGNAGGAYRASDVDLAATPNGGFTVGWTSAGEWLKYTVNVTASGYYRVVARVASAGAGGAFHIELNGVDRTGTMSVPNTGSWTTYQDVAATAWLDAGVQSMRILMDTVGSTGATGNFSFVRFEQGGGEASPAPAPAPAPAPPSQPSGGGGGGGGRLRVMTWNIHFGNGDPWGQATDIVNSGTDVALLQEASTFDEYMPATYRDRLQQLTGQTWYTAWGPSNPEAGGSQGTLILSRYPIVDSTSAVLSGTGTVRALIDVGGVYVNVFNLHLEYFDTGKRTTQLYQFLDWTRQFGGPRIAGGDFNSWWGEWWIAQMESEYSDTWQDVTGSDENGYTLNGAVRFDYLFRAYDQAWRLAPTSCWVQSTGRSDHAAVIADYSVR